MQRAGRRGRRRRCRPAARVSHGATTRGNPSPNPNPTPNTDPDPNPNPNPNPNLDPNPNPNPNLNPDLPTLTLTLTLTVLRLAAPACKADALLMRVNAAWAKRRESAVRDSPYP
eukprot:scaffold60817_cov40-Phaeocystis_antarctica.AAC.2